MDSIQYYINKLERLKYFISLKIDFPHAGYIRNSMKIQIIGPSITLTDTSTLLKNISFDEFENNAIVILEAD